jgi:hypothetical protein
MVHQLAGPLKIWNKYKINYCDQALRNFAIIKI